MVTANGSLLINYLIFSAEIKKKYSSPLFPFVYNTIMTTLKYAINKLNPSNV